MEPGRRWILLQLLRLMDLFMMAGCFFLAASAVSYTIQELSFEEFLELRIKLKNFLLFPLIMMMWTAVFSSFRLYDSRRLSTWREDVADILKATALGTACIVLSGLVFRISLVTPTFLAAFFASISVSTILFRLSLKFALRKARRHGHNLRFVVLIGTNSRAIRIARDMEAATNLGYRVLGFADDAWSGMDEFRKTGYPLVSALAGLSAFLRANVVDEVFVCLPLKTCYEEAARIVDLCGNHGITVRFLSDVFNRFDGSPVASLHDVSLITSSATAMNSRPALAKRGIDILVSLALLALLSPLFLLVAALIKIDSRGPVFFHQERMGINKRKFRVHKFRTMVEGAEEMQAKLEHLNEADGAAFKIRNDPRVTPVGRSLRKTSLDELPQLYNVLKGEMSLVGPRPLPVRDYEAFYRDWHRRRFSIRPGITCLWQVNGRTNLTFEHWMEMDLQYIDHWSLWLDLKILVKTIPAVLKGTGAA